MSLRLVPLLSALVLVVTGAGIAPARVSATTSPHTVKVAAKDFRFVLSTRTVPHGRIRFVITNRGSAEHDFAIAKHTSKTIQPGQRTVMTMTLRRGRYPYRCTVDSHTELGMKGVLRVS
jgi:plastocyanin